MKSLNEWLKDEGIYIDSDAQEKIKIYVKQHAIAFANEINDNQWSYSEVDEFGWQRPASIKNSGKKNEKILYQHSTTDSLYELFKS